MKPNDYIEIAARSYELAGRLNKTQEAGELANQQKLIVYHLRGAAKLAQAAGEWLAAQETEAVQKTEMQNA